MIEAIGLVYPFSIAELLSLRIDRLARFFRIADAALKNRRM